MRSRFPAVLFVLALLSSALAWWLIAWPVVIADRAPKHVEHFSLVYAHMAGGTVMLVFGSAALYIGWTRRYFHLHRLCGYAYLAGGALSSSLAALLPPGVSAPWRHQRRGHRARHARDDLARRVCDGASCGP